MTVYFYRNMTAGKLMSLPGARVLLFFGWRNKANHNLFPANRRRLAVKGGWVTGFLGESTAWFQALSTCSFGSRPKCAKKQLSLFGLKRAQPANQATLLIHHNESRKRLERLSWATLPPALWDRHFSGRVYTLFSPGKKSDIPTNQSSLPLLGTCRRCCLIP